MNRYRSMYVYMNIDLWIHEYRYRRMYIHRSICTSGDAESSRVKKWKAAEVSLRAPHRTSRMHVLRFCYTHIYRYIDLHICLCIYREKDISI